MKKLKIFFLVCFVGLLAASDSEEDDPMPASARKIHVNKGIGAAKAKTIKIDQSKHTYLGADYEETEEDDLRDSFTSILGMSAEAYQAHEDEIKGKYQQALISSDFSELIEVAEREKGSVRSPFAKAFMGHLLLNSLTTHRYPVEEGERYVYACIKFFKKLQKDKRSGISLFLKGSLYEYEFRKTGKAEKKIQALEAYTKAAQKFNDDEAQLRLGDLYKLENPTIARNWYQKVIRQNKPRTYARAQARIRELDAASGSEFWILDNSPDWT